MAGAAEAMVLEEAPAPIMRLGRYTLDKQLGKGSEGRVFLGRKHGAAGISQPVVIKLAHERARMGVVDAKSVVQRAVARKRFLAEAHRALLLGSASAHVVGVTDVEDIDGVAFLVMDYVDGADLHKVLAFHRHGRGLDPKVACSILCDMARGLHYAHVGREVKGKPLHMVHRDVKPANTLVTFSGYAKLIDFGISKIGKTPKYAQSGSAQFIVGSPRYMSPQHIYRDVCPAMDMYSLGIVAWEMLENRAFPRSWEDAIGDPDYQAPVIENPAVPREVAQLIGECLQLDKVMRPNAYEFARTLSKFAVGDSDTARQLVAKMVCEVLGRRAQSAFSQYIEVPRELRDDELEAALAKQPSSKGASVPVDVGGLMFELDRGDETHQSDKPPWEVAEEREAEAARKAEEARWAAEVERRAAASPQDDEQDTRTQEISLLTRARQLEELDDLETVALPALLEAPGEPSPQEPPLLIGPRQEDAPWLVRRPRNVPRSPADIDVRHLEAALLRRSQFAEHSVTMMLAQADADDKPSVSDVDVSVEDMSRWPHWMAAVPDRVAFVAGAIIAMFFALLLFLILGAVGVLP